MTAEPTLAAPASSVALRPNSIGVVGMIFMIVAATAPLTALATNIAVSIAYGVGIGTVGLFVVVGVLLAVFAVGYLLLARYVKSAGGQAAFVSFGLGKPAGTAVAFVATIAYNAAAAGMSAATGFYASMALAMYTGIEIPWYVFTLVALAALAALGMRGLGPAEKITIGSSLLQFVFVGILAVCVAVQNPGGWTLQPFAPEAVFSGNLALSLVFILLSFGGFETSTIYSEEARGGHRSVARATYVALALLAVVFVISTWTLVAAYDDVVGVTAADPGAIVVATASEYIGDWSGGVILLLIMISFFGAAIAFHNMAARYQFALARAHLLPKALTRTRGQHAAPYVSSLVQVGFSFLLLLPFVLMQVDVFSTLFPAISGITALSLIAMMVGASISVVVARARGKIAGGWLTARIAPLVSAVILTAIGVLIVVNYSAVTGSDSPVFWLMPLIPAVAGVYGAIRQRQLPASPGIEGYIESALEEE
ncbi:APC family permease [Microbacterium ureisolvens]|uniref:APC family permease n=1 Tax=Microbacterium ureisolvens TaxID=2781186 RepID=A0ABS7I0P6_9MICO|nr:APC family permease [Microbacterium ureisolvens]MBW9110674.1 APC family permease [Microbacterium ureisolvens]